MAVDERSRHELHTAIERFLGPEHAATLMAMLPGTGWADVATRMDLDGVVLRTDALERHLVERMDALERRVGECIEGLERRVEERLRAVERWVEERLAETERRVEERMDVKLAALEHRVVATLEARLREQTRTMVFALIGALMALSALTLTAAGLAG